MAAMTGGDKLMAYLKSIDDRLASAGNEPNVRVGFLEGATYPDGTSVPLIAAQNEFGGTVQQPARTITLYRKVNKAGTHFLRNGRFVKRSQANFSSQHAVAAHAITIPPRPFFRRMIAAKGRTWGAEIAKLLKANNYHAARTLDQMGLLIKGQLQESILNFTTPRNAPSTIARKGFDRPLIDTGYMLQSVDYEVTSARTAGSFGGIAGAYVGGIGSR